MPTGFHVRQVVGAEKPQDAPAAFGLAQEEPSRGLELIHHVGRERHIAESKCPFPFDRLLGGKPQWYRLLQRPHEFEIPILNRKEIPLPPRLVLDHDFQRRAKLGDRGPRPRRPVGEPSLYPADRAPGELTLTRASPPPEVGDRAEDRAMTVPGARGVAALLSPARLEEGQHDQAPV